MILYWWTHWFWITTLFIQTFSSPIPFSSLETISTSLKSALVQNDNSFQKSGDLQKMSGNKIAVPLTFETSDLDDVFGVASEVNAESIAKNDDLMKRSYNKSSSTPPEPENTKKPKLISVKLEQSKNVSTINSNSSSNVNSTNATQSQAATTMLTSVTESNIR